MVFKDFLTTVKSTVSSLLLEPVPTNQTEQPDTNILDFSNPYQYPMELKRTPAKKRDVHFDDFSSTRLPSSGLIPLSNKRKFIPTSSGVVPGNVPSNKAIYLKNGVYQTIHKAEPNYQTVFTIPIKPEEQGSSSKVCFEYDFNSIKELKVSTSRDTALTIKDEFHETESELDKEINDLKDQLNTKQKIFEEKDVILESTLQDEKVAAQKGKEMHQSQLELQLAHQENLRLTNLNDQLENQLTELKRSMEEIRAERGKFRLLYEDATFLSAEEARKLAEQTRQQAADNGLLLSDITKLKTELAASLSQIDELKKEKGVLLCNASTATESRLRNEIVNLKSKIEDQNETLSSTKSELERIKLDDSFLYISLESTKAMLAEKETENEDLNIRNWDLKREKSLLEVYNKNLKREAED
jgi:hypothetical protein